MVRIENDFSHDIFIFINKQYNLLNHFILSLQSVQHLHLLKHDLNQLFVVDVLQMNPKPKHTGIDQQLLYVNDYKNHEL